MSFLEYLLPPAAITHERVKLRYLGTYRTLLILAGFIAGIIPIYVLIRGSLAGDEFVAIFVAFFAPILGIISIRFSANLVLGMLLTTVLTTGAYFDMAYHTGGLTSFVMPWFITNLAVQGLFGSKWALKATYWILAVEFSSLLLLGRMGFLPEDNTPPEYLEWAFALSLATALTAMAWVGSIAQKYRHKSKIQLKEARNKAEAANQAKSRFLTSMSHELRTPMNAIMGFAQILETDPDNPPTEDQREAINHILKGGDHLMELINQVLDLAKIETGNLALTIEKLPLSDVGQECLVLVDKQALASNLTINNHLDTAHSVMADYTRFKQILLNLISNAIKYNHEGGSITLTSKTTSANMLRLTVADTGAGIARDKQAQIFEPFNRLGKEAGKIEGTGIGLAITKQLVEAMGGRIGYEGEPETGSSFWIELPTLINRT